MRASVGTAALAIASSILTQNILNGSGNDRQSLAVSCFFFFYCCSHLKCYFSKGKRGCANMSRINLQTCGYLYKWHPPSKWYSAEYTVLAAKLKAKTHSDQLEQNIFQLFNLKKEVNVVSSNTKCPFKIKMKCFLFRHLLKNHKIYLRDSFKKPAFSSSMYSPNWSAAAEGEKFVLITSITSKMLSTQFH